MVNNLETDVSDSTIQSVYYGLGRRGSNKKVWGGTTGWRHVPFEITHHFHDLAKSPVPTDINPFAKVLSFMIYRGCGLVAVVTSYFFKEMAQHAHDVNIHQPFCMKRRSKINLLKSYFETEKAFNDLPKYDFKGKNIAAWQPTNLPYPVMKGVARKKIFFIVLSKNATEAMTIFIKKGEVFMHHRNETVKVMTDGILSPKKSEVERTFQEILEDSKKEKKEVSLRDSGTGGLCKIDPKNYRSKEILYRVHQNNLKQKVAFEFDEYIQLVQDVYLIPKENKAKITRLLPEELPTVLHKIIMDYYFMSGPDVAKVEEIKS